MYHIMITIILSLFSANVKVIISHKVKLFIHVCVCMHFSYVIRLNAVKQHIYVCVYEKVFFYKFISFAVIIILQIFP